MDSKTLKKVLGQVSHVVNMFAAKISIFHIRTAALFCTSKHGVRVCLSSKHGFQVNLPSWVNFPDFERVGWLNSVMGKFLPNVFVKSATSPHTAESSKLPTCCHVCGTTACTPTADIASVITFWDIDPVHNLFLTIHSKQPCLADMLITPSPYAHSLQIGCVQPYVFCSACKFWIHRHQAIAAFTICMLQLTSSNLIVMLCTSR